MKKFKTTCAIIINKHNEILLIKRCREPYKGFWALVSGIGESKKGLPPEKAIIGEVLWDLGTSFLNSKDKPIFSLTVHDNEFTDEVVVFVGTVKEQKIKMRQGVVEIHKWVSLNNDKELKGLAFEHSQIIQEYLKCVRRSSKE